MSNYQMVMKLNGGEALAVEQCLSIWMKFSVERSVKDKRLNSEARRQLLGELNKSSLVSYKRGKMIIVPGTWRFQHPRSIFKHMLLCCQTSYELGYDKRDNVSRAIKKLERVCGAGQDRKRKA